MRVTDYGIRGMHLAYDLAEGFDTTILVDTAQRGEAPGTVYLIEPEPQAGQGDAASLSLFNAHGMQPDLVLSLAGSLGVLNCAHSRARKPNPPAVANAATITAPAASARIPARRPEKSNSRGLVA